MFKKLALSVLAIICFTSISVFAKSPFVKIKNQQLYVGDKPYYFIGTNYRTNKFCKKRYVDDSTIMAWELANEHCPIAEEEVEVLIFEPKNVLNTGIIEDEKYTSPISDKV
jgi:hypothetical protein